MVNFAFDSGSETKWSNRQFHRLKKWPDVRHGPGNNYILAGERDNFGRGLVTNDVKFRGRQMLCNERVNFFGEVKHGINVRWVQKASDEQKIGTVSKSCRRRLDVNDV